MDLWLFAVEDGDGCLCSGVSTDGTISTFRVSDWSTADDFTAATLHTVIETADLPTWGVDTATYTHISDYWHIYAYDAHWIAAALVEPSTPTDLSRGVLLIKLNAAGDEVDDAHQVYPDPTVYASPTTDTNDLFLATGPGDSTGGLVIGIKNPSTSGGELGHLLLWYDDAFGYVGSTTGPIHFFHDGYDHANGASVALDAASGVTASDGSTGRRVLAPETLSPLAEGRLLEIVTTSDWELDTGTDAKVLLDRADFSFSMATAGRLSDGRQVIAYRRFKKGSGGSDRLDDDGTIHLVIDNASDDGLVPAAYPRPSRLDGTEKLGGRPHLTVLSDDTVIVCWDDEDRAVKVAVYDVIPSSFAPWDWMPHPDGDDEGDV